MIRQTQTALLTAEYEVFDGEKKVGAARVYEGVITVLAAATDAEEEYKGQILSVLLRNICQEANNCNANLSIMIPETTTSRLKRVLERYAFRQTHRDIYKRTAGSSIPPSVIY